MKKLSSLLLVFAFLLLLLPPSGAAEVKVAAFTFDDGPSKTITPALLDALAERGVRATFFVNGRNAELYPDIVLRAAAEGHQIANHTYSHSNLNTLSTASIEKEVSRTQNYLSDLLGEKDYLVRVPYGACNSTVRSAITVPIILWSVDPTSGKVMSAEKMRDGIVRTAHDGAIILLHDTSTSNLNAAIQSIDRLLEEGYTFVTVDELFEIKGEVPAGGTIYYKVTGENVGDFFDESQLSSHWAYREICAVQEAGLMIGDERGFRPNWGMTRAEAVTVLYRMVGTPEYQEKARFTDVDQSAWYAPAVNWALENEVTSGISQTLFGVNQYITKEQFYTLLSRLLQNTLLPQEEQPEVMGAFLEEPDGKTGEKVEPVTESKAEDAAKETKPESGGSTIPKTAISANVLPGDETASAWAQGPIAWLRSCGFVSHEQTPRFAPRSLMTRGETAELLTWYLEFVA